MFDLGGFITLVEGVQGEEGDDDREMLEAFKLYDVEGTGYSTAKSLKDIE